MFNFFLFKTVRHPILDGNIIIYKIFQYFYQVWQIVPVLSLSVAAFGEWKFLI